MCILERKRWERLKKHISDKFEAWIPFPNLKIRGLLCVNFVWEKRMRERGKMSASKKSAVPWFGFSLIYSPEMGSSVEFMWIHIVRAQKVELSV